MNLPSYFLADLPPDAELTPQVLTEACQTLKRNQADYLVHRPTQSLLESLDALAKEWLNPEYPFRRAALDLGPAATGFSPATLARGLDAFFQQLTYDHLVDWITQELGHKDRLDEFVASNSENRGHRSSLARGPALIAHIGAGNVPSSTLGSMLSGLLTHSAQLVKCATGASYLPRLFAHSLYEVEPKLAACLEIAEWPGGDNQLEEALFHEADCVTATGNDETLLQIRQRIPSSTRFLGYGHRVSFAYVAADALSAFNVGRVAALAAADVTAWNQLGCLSPHLFYVQHGGRITSEQFAEALAEELAKLEETEPRGMVSEAMSVHLTTRRSFYEVRAAYSSETRCWFSPGSTAWSVVYEQDPLFQMSCLHRFVYVKGVSHLTEALHAADAVAGQVSTVGLAASAQQARQLALELARWGVTRVCPLGQMQNPPLAWRHDGRPALADLVTWTDWEQ